jgi:hypothetical protein
LHIACHYPVGVEAAGLGDSHHGITGVAPHSWDLLAHTDVTTQRVWQNIPHYIIGR